MRNIVYFFVFDGYAPIAQGGQSVDELRDDVAHVQR